MKRIELPAYTPALMRVSKWAMGNMQFNVLLSNIAAINEMSNTETMLRARPDLRRHRLKQVLNIAIRESEHMKAVWLAYTKDKKVMDDFSDHICDVIEEDVTKLRSLLTDAALNAGVADGDAETVAWVESAHMLLHLTVNNYWFIIKKANTKAEMVTAMSKDGIRHDFDRHMHMYCADNLLSAWQKVVCLSDPAPDIVTRQDVLEQLKLITRGYGGGVYLNECIKRMDNHPFFAPILEAKRQEKENT